MKTKKNGWYSYLFSVLLAALLLSAGCSNPSSNSASDSGHEIRPLLFLPALGGDSLFFTVKQFVISLNKNNGKLQWQYKANNTFNGSDLLNTALTYTNNVLMFNEYRLLHGLNASTGKELWELPEYSSEVFLDNDLAYYTAYNDVQHTIKAINPATSSTKWEYPIQEPTSDPLLHKGKVFIGSFEKLYVYNINDMTRFEQTLIGGMPILEYRPSVGSHDDVFFGDEGYLYAMDSTTNSELWRYKTESLSADYSPAFSEDRLYFGDNKTLICLDSTNANVIWKIPNADYVYYPVITGQNLIYFSNQKILSVDKKIGKENWHINVEGDGTSKPLVDGNILYYGDSISYFHAVDITTKKEIWKFNYEEFLSKEKQKNT